MNIMIQTRCDDSEEKSSSPKSAYLDSAWQLCNMTPAAIYQPPPSLRLDVWCSPNKASVLCVFSPWSMSTSFPPLLVLAVAEQHTPHWGHQEETEEKAYCCLPKPVFMQLISRGLTASLLHAAVKPNEINRLRYNAKCVPARSLWIELLASGPFRLKGDYPRCCFHSKWEVLLTQELRSNRGMHMALRLFPPHSYTHRNSHLVTHGSTHLPVVRFYTLPSIICFHQAWTSFFV